MGAPAATATDVAGFGPTVFVFAHPDDESYVAGGAMGMLAASGERVVCVTATHGEQGGDPGVRVAELASALGALGVREHHLLGLPDGGCAPLEPAAPVATLVSVLDEVQPRTVVTFPANGLTGHTDHVAVSRWTSAATRHASSRPRVLHAAAEASHAARFPDMEALGVYEPGARRTTVVRDLAVDLTLDPAALDRKLAALASHGSQTRWLVERLGLVRFREWLSRESFVEAAPATAVVPDCTTTTPASIALPGGTTLSEEP
jgi:LmbE family N-acetylglucosaminyl deacetylase